MAEYIDKTATVGILEAMSRSADCECIKKRLEKAAKRVGAIPVADVPPVVRCKDCKYRIYKDMGEEIGEIGGCALFNCAMTNDDFCSYGEKKDGGDAEG